MATAKPTFEKPVRVYELARQFEVSSKELIQWLQERGYSVKSHSNTLKPEAAAEVVQRWKQEHAPPPPPRQESAEKTASEAPRPAPEVETRPEPTPSPSPSRPQPESVTPRRRSETSRSERRRPKSRRQRPSSAPQPPPVQKTPDLIIGADDRRVLVKPTPEPSSAKREPSPAKEPRPEPTGRSEARRSLEERRAQVAYSSRVEGRDSTRTYYSPSERRRRQQGVATRETLRRRPTGERTGSGRGRRPERPGVSPVAETISPAQSRHRTQKEREREREERLERLERREEERAAAKVKITQQQAKSASEADTDLVVPKRDELIEVEEGSTVAEVAQKVGVKPSTIIAHLFKHGVMATINQPLDTKTLELLEEPFQFITVKRKSLEERLLEKIDMEDDPESLVPRAPIITIMGHVDHGKTTMLDAVRESNIAAKEAGQITQHIGAYDVHLESGRVVFLDTPGHEAFTAMRARGAQVTDVVVLVVAADDGVMPQTIEAINHAKAAGVPIVVAINKIDVPNANPERVKQQLAQHGLIPEEWGGDTVFVEVSAKQRIGIDELLEYLALESELLELKANPNRPAIGTIIESKLDPGRGPVGTVLVQNGTLHVGDYFVAGTTHGRVRALITDQGESVESAGPSTPVEVLGFDEVPNPGDRFLVLSEEDAKALAEERRQQARAERLRRRAQVTLDELHKQLQEGEVKDLNIIVKADVEGSIEAITNALGRFDSEEVRVQVIHSGVGAVTETDVMLAAASNAVVIGFNVRPTPEAREAAEQKGVDIRLYTVIYDIVNDIRAALEGLLEPEVQEVVLGRAEVRETFRVPRFGVVAGCYVTNGRIVRNANLRVLRDNRVIQEGKVDSLRRFKEDVTEVAAGYECGIAMANFDDFKVGDVLECFTFEEVERTLDSSSRSKE